MLFLINWTVANLLTGLTMLCLILIPVVALYIAFRKRSGADANKEAYDKLKGQQQ